MDSEGQFTTRRRSAYLQATLVALAWTAAIVMLVSWYLVDRREGLYQVAHGQAIAAYGEDMLFRRWCAGHGGVYVPVTDTTQPNPYLHAPERDITTPSGRQLTLVNAAWMTRDVHKMAMEETGVRAHITSLRPLRPENTPDTWESEALRAFATGTSEYCQTVELGGQPFMRLMQPLRMEQSCMRCHAQQGYKVGDMRGGLSVAVPVGPLYAASAQEVRRSLCRYAGLWLAGVVGIFLGARLVQHRSVERDRMEARLAQQYQFLQRLVDAIPVPVFHKDIRGVHLMCNKALCEMLGLPPERILGKTIREFLPADTADRHQEQDDALYREGKPQCRETTMSDGKGPFEAIIYKGLVHNTDGAVTGVIGTILDISARKRAEQALEAARAETEAVNRQLQQSLEVANEMAQKADNANRAKSEFLANMSHEIRTPLTAILGYTEILLDSTTASATEKTYLEILHRNGEHLLSLINDILDLSKVEAGKILGSLAPCNPVGIIAEVVSLMRVRALEKSLSLTVEYPTPLPETIMADEAHLRQVLVNLVSNATKFTHTGGVRIVTRLVPEWRQGEPAIQIEVIDTGIGIAPHDLARIGETFFQVDGSRSRLYGGTGLGLAITRRLVVAMKGDFSVQSVPGHGSSFAITLPTGPLDGIHSIESPAEAVYFAAAAHNAAPEPTALAGRQILLAEDGPDNQLLISTVLKQAGARVEIACNGRRAIEQIAAGHFDAVLMDIQMPEMDGYHATQELRRRGSRLPIIALTAHALSDERGRCLAAGCDEYLSKPLDRHLLIETLQRFTASSAQEAAPPASGPIHSNYADDVGMSQVIEEFVHVLPQRMAAMHEALRGSGYGDLQRLAHQLKGAGGGYGYPDLTQAACLLETAAKAADPEASRLALGDLEHMIARITAGRAAATRQPDDETYTVPHEAASGDSEAATA
jgi:PAS domain S-box-containing protein